LFFLLSIKLDYVFCNAWTFLKTSLMIYYLLHFSFPSHRRGFYFKLSVLHNRYYFFSSFLFTSNSCQTHLSFDLAMKVIYTILVKYWQNHFAISTTCLLTNNSNPVDRVENCHWNCFLKRHLPIQFRNFLSCLVFMLRMNHWRCPNG